ncbi:MAG TPA: DUF3572 domain-containing protein [Beijerinckiaceae bacterium]|nr:DUF3572 domain-containing protein [Beijerinckiaceae bacterium]
MQRSEPVDKSSRQGPIEKFEISQGDAQTMAIEALTFLAADDDRLQNFLSLSGLTPVTLRAAAATPGFLLAVLDHIASSETLLLAYSSAAALDPRAIARARAALGGPQAEWSP